MLTKLYKTTKLLLAIIISLLIAMRLGFKSPEWALTSVLVISVGSVGEIKSKWLQRILGNFIGCFCGFFIIWEFISTPYILIFVTCFFIGFFSYMSLTDYLRSNLYKWIAIGFIIILSSAIDAPDSAFFVLQDRIGCVFIGSTVILLINIAWPNEIVPTIEKKYVDLLDNLKGWGRVSNNTLEQSFLEFNHSISELRKMVSTNYLDILVNMQPDRKIINNLYYVEILAEHLYCCKQKKLDNDEFISWFDKSIDALVINDRITKYPNSLKHSLYFLIYEDFCKLHKNDTHINEQSYLRLQWHNRMFHVGTDSPLVSAAILMIAVFICMILWINGWPGGGVVMMLTSVCLITCQYGQRISAGGYVIGFFVGCIYAFPFYILILPSVNNEVSFILFVLLVYFPIAYFMMGDNPKLSSLALAIGIITNADSNDYIIENGYFEHYITLAWVVIAMSLVSFPILSAFLNINPQMRLHRHIYAWKNDCRKHLMMKDSSYITPVRLLCRSEIIYSLYSKLDSESQNKWREVVFKIPLLHTKIR